MSVKTINCPDCGLVLRVADDAAAFKFVYDMRDWQLLCRRVQIGDAVWCLLQHDGTSPAQPRLSKNEHEHSGEMKSRLQRATPRDRRWDPAR
jgi:hypothetical protein